MITAIPVNGRIRVTYLGNNPDYRLSGVNPSVSALHFAGFLQAVQSLQTPAIDTSTIFVETDLVEA
jgi:hypothetical protein